MADGSGSNPTEHLARELWEAYAARSQSVINFPTLHWDELEPFDRDTWMMLARVAISYRVG